VSPRWPEGSQESLTLARTMGQSMDINTKNYRQPAHKESQTCQETIKTCQEKYDPRPLKEEIPNGNTMAAEQTFVWLSRYKKILCAMPKVHHLFYLHRIVKHRNKYTVKCYKNGKKPLLPKARKIQS
jgi:hypothetical protein